MLSTYKIIYPQGDFAALKFTAISSSLKLTAYAFWHLLR